MSKFHVGQKIRVVNAKPKNTWSHLNGKTGVVTDVRTLDVHDVDAVFDDGTCHPEGDPKFGFTDDELEAVEEQPKPGFCLYYPGDGQAYGPYRVVATDGDETWVKPVSSPGEHPDTPWEMGFVVKTNELKPLSPYARVDKTK